MNSVGYQGWLAERRALAPSGSLLAALYSSEGVEATDDAVRRGLRAWAVERRGSGPIETRIVFGRSGSDALRRASAPARLGESILGEQTFVVEILSEWTEPVAWPR